jgi:colicin import membrane protein
MAAKLPAKKAAPSNAKIAEQPLSKSSAKNSVKTTSVAVNKNSNTAAADQKKKQELAAAKKKEAEQLAAAKKIEAEQLAQRERQQKLVDAAQERMSKITASRDQTVSERANSSSSAVPQAIASLEVDALPASKGAPPLSGREAAYRDELAGRLKLQLRLPEYGDVKVNLTLDRAGKVVKAAIVSAESAANRRYIEKTLSGLSFPAFGTNFESAPEYTFAITLSNE